MVLHSYAPEWSYAETKERLLSIDREIVRDFSIALYCLGARLNEVRLGLRPKDITETTISNGEKRLLVSVYTEKNPYLERRNVPINPFLEKEYAEVLTKIKDGFQENDLPVFACYCERSYRLWIRQALDIHPHSFRHLRVHHIDDQEVPGMKALTPRQFKDYFGWERIETSAQYQSRTRGKDLAERT